MFARWLVGFPTKRQQNKDTNLKRRPTDHSKPIQPSQTVIIANKIATAQQHQHQHLELELHTNNNNNIDCVLVY